MQYQDRIYGNFEITEPVILDLIDSPTLQRLKRINQGGYVDGYFPNTAHYRFEHSMGVYLLLKKFGASLEEQIAGLIHDVSHSAFSHSIDYVLAEGSQEEQSHQDNIFAEFVLSSEIPTVLAKHKIDLEYILEDKNFPLKEKEIPELCADRLDYALRESVIFKIADLKEIENLISSLQVIEGKEWIFNSFASAKKYADLFYQLNNEFYASVNTALMYRSTADYLKHSLQRGYITQKDLYTDDQAVLDKIRAHWLKDPELEKLFKRMNNQSKWENNPQDFDVQVFCKSRFVDPKCLDMKGEIRRVSEVDPSWQQVMEKEKAPKEYFLKFLD